MPHIPANERPELRNYAAHLGRTVNSVGQLNYVITTILRAYARKNGRSYQTFNALRGVLGCVWDDFRENEVAPYERMKASLNGNVYNESLPMGLTE